MRPLKRLVLPARAAKRALLGPFSTLPRIESSTLQYAELHTEISLREIHPAETVVVAPAPFTNGATPSQQKCRPARVFEIPNVVFWAHYGGAVVTSDQALLADLSPEVWGVAHHPIFSRWCLPAAKPLDGRIAIAVTPEAGANYYHWMLDLLPRLFLLKHATGNFANYDSVLLNGSRGAYESESLSALGVPAEKVRYVDGRHRFQIASAVIPSMDDGVAPWKIRAFRELAPHSENAKGRLYISRRRASVRRVRNDAEITPLLRDHGFAIVELENLSWREQVRLFAQAEVILGPHGAALANCVFCKPGAYLAEIATRAGYRDWFLRLSAAAQLRYRCIEAAPLPGASAKSNRAYENDDMLVTRESIEQFLATL